MVGSVLMDRMRAEYDFIEIEPRFFISSLSVLKAPDVGIDVPFLQKADDIGVLTTVYVVVTCQGGDYTNAVYPDLRKAGWKGYWIDAASALRMNDTSVIVLDPVNSHVIDQALKDGVKDFVGGNCTVSLMLMALVGLFKQDLVE